MDNYEKVRQAYEVNEKINPKLPTNDWIKSRVKLEVLSLVPDFDFTGSEDDDDSIFVDNVCFFLRKYWIHPGLSQLWAAYLVQTPWGQVYEKKKRIRNTEDLIKVYEQRFIEQ
jgi:hypothetical protein